MKVARQFLWSKRLVAFALVVASSVMMATNASSSAPTAPTSTMTRESTTSSTLEKERKHESLSKQKANDVVARFYLIRHGQTLANLDGLVLGQTDSPLTAQGEEQARLLGRSDLITSEDFWRRYTSDLGRARQTANLVLGEEKSLEDHGVQLEPLLREVAKGVREMYPKVLNYEQATELFRKEHGAEEPFPLLESEDEVMARVYQWMFQVVRDAIQEYLVECQAAKDSTDTNDKTPRVYPVFAVSHSATLRAVIGRLVRDELPTTINFSPVGRDGAQKGALQVPNTSVTIIDISPKNIRDELWDPERTSPPNPSFLWNAKLKTLTYTKHYQDV